MRLPERPTFNDRLVNSHFVSNKDESVRMFQSDFLEKFTHVHPAVPHVLFVPVVVFFLWRSPAGLGTTALLFLAVALALGGLMALGFRNPRDLKKP